MKYIDISVILILINIIIFIINKDRQIGFTMENVNILKIIVSMFSHKDVYHLLGNMITFYFSAAYVINFINSWKKFLFIYLLSGLFGSYFEIFIFNYLNFQWQSEVSQVADQYNYRFFNAAPVVSLFYKLVNYDKIDALNKVYYKYHYGAESCIYGIIGVGVYLFIINFKADHLDFKAQVRKSRAKGKYGKVTFYIIKYGYDIFSSLTVLFDIFSKFINVPWNINMLMNLVISNKMKHNSHLGGAVMGLLITILMFRNKEENNIIK
jgi:membrane associated rhomboid family serine protease